MKEKNTKYSLIIGFFIALINFLLLLIGVRFVLIHAVILQNVIAYSILSLILGGITAVLIYFRLKLAVIIYFSGIIIGFINLFAMFIKDTNGWGDLTGFMSYLAWLIIGFLSGLMIQFVLYLYKKIRQK
ncbi:hypothetical protein [Anaerocolumna sp. MB42-C2]|uniref:hypothetical protein n=1 Tax=Anaerocolumna sp. MB42-C2 TaxID=3070997 RepID=UPI0027E19DD0|nr:hypothetical protein [Anaerocolumna sp. MB42-C2]WMJ88782.1 hypothetical protein RBU59_04505 [Anaerocolumna sp. MB42-C2]